MIMKRILTVLISIFFAGMVTFCSSTVRGQPSDIADDLKAQTLRKGGVAKFDGILFSIPLVVKMKVEKSFLEKKCEEQVRYESEKVIAKWKAKLEKNTIIHEAMIRKLKAEGSMLNEQLDYCHEELEDQISSSSPWYESPYLWFPVGVIVGSGMTIAIVYATDH